MSFQQDIIKALNYGLDKYYQGKYSHLAKAAGVHGTTVKKILSGERVVWLGSLSRIADAAKIKVYQDGESTSVDTILKCLPLEDQTHNDFCHIPLFDATGAMKYIEAVKMQNLPEILPIRHVQISKYIGYIQYRSGLIAMEIPENENCMSRTLNPGDIVVIDINECSPQSPPGNIYIVHEPGENKAQVKRVRTQRVHDSDFLVFYGDNSEFGPKMFSLERDYNGKIMNAVKGKVVAAFISMYIK
jgi:transcriptional regulator with XRE-family HTH domain